MKKYFAEKTIKLTGWVVIYSWRGVGDDHTLLPRCRLLPAISGNTFMSFIDGDAANAGDACSVAGDCDGDLLCDQIHNKCCKYSSNYDPNYYNTF